MIHFLSRFNSKLNKQTFLSLFFNRRPSPVFFWVWQVTVKYLAQCILRLSKARSAIDHAVQQGLYNGQTPPEKQITPPKQVRSIIFPLPIYNSPTPRLDRHGRVYLRITSQLSQYCNKNRIHAQTASHLTSLSPSFRTVCMYPHLISSIKQIHMITRKKSSFQAIVFPERRNGRKKGCGFERRFKSEREKMQNFSQTNGGKKNLERKFSRKIECGKYAKSQFRSCAETAPPPAQVRLNLRSPASDEPRRTKIEEASQ